LSPTELLELAAELEIDMLSITDHDTLEAYRDISGANNPIKIIPGIELSSQWNRRGVHIVGLNVNLSSESILEGVKQQSNARRERAQKIAEKLQRFGFDDCLAGAQSFASGPDQIGRPHFARHLVKIGAVSNIQQAFKRYLGAGKAGDIKDQWADPQTVIGWIRDAGGVAVLAHPTKYKLTRSKLVELLVDFKVAGGEAMEVISGSQVPSVTRDMARLAKDMGFDASCGSDFHAPNQEWAALGRVAPLPENCTAVWQRWQ
jgi:predicted metal-dependent phosphoesterase TrpH